MKSCPSLLPLYALSLIFVLVPIASADSAKLSLSPEQKVAVIGNSLAERMNLFGDFETRFQLRNAGKKIQFRNFGWPADEVANRQRPNSYTTIDDPLKIYSPNVFLCFYGFNESFAGTSPETLAAFRDAYRQNIANMASTYGADGKAQFVLISPTAFEKSDNPLAPDADQINAALAAYTQAIQEVAQSDGHLFVDLFTPTSELFNATIGAQFTINGVHLNEAGDRVLGRLLDAALFGSEATADSESDLFKRINRWVNDKSWYHLQDYRMLNGWYVYGGRRTWDTETFPTEYRKIRNMVQVRDQYIWDLVAGRPVPDEPDDSNTGSVFTPETMFGTRDENFRQMREPKELRYPSPEESIEMMSIPEGFKVELFASEREFPELANPNQIAFDSKGRLWVSCMANYPQWQPGAAKPNDRLLILEDTDNDGKADTCKTFYDKLICPTGFEFYNGGVLVVDEPRILFIKDTDGDDVADEVTHLIDGIATDDTHHTVGAWEFSHGGQLHMLEGVSLSTTMETPWGPVRNRNTGGVYTLDPVTLQMSHYRTPGYGNPWCMVFDPWGNGIVGDGTNAKQHWIAPLAGKEVPSRKTLTPVFDNEGMRPAVGNEFLLSRHLPDEMQGQFIYACVINMHGMPRFNLRYESNGAGYQGERVDDLLSSTDMIFRPVDPKIGPDGAIWFGDWCNALIGHMQYSQRDPNRDHTHGRVYRMINTKKPLLPVVDYSNASIRMMLDDLRVPELRTRYRIRRELRARDRAEVLATVRRWAAEQTDALQLCEAMWIQESFRELDPSLLARILSESDYRARAAAINAITNERDRVDGFHDYLAAAVKDPHPRVRLEALRGISFLETPDATELALAVSDQPMDHWLEYTMEHTLQALEPQWSEQQKNENFLANSSEQAKKYFQRYVRMSGPGGDAVIPLEIAENVDGDMRGRYQAVRMLAGIRGGNADRGANVFKQVCSACHMIGDLGKKFGPELSDIGQRMDTEKLIRSILMPNDEIAKGYETVQVLDVDGKVTNGFVLAETDEKLTLGVANGKTEEILKDDIELTKPMKASSMPEGLITQIAPIEFLDLVEFLKRQRAIGKSTQRGWISPTYRTAPKLREHNGVKEIAYDAALKFGPHFADGGYNENAHLFLTTVEPDGWRFSFHSVENVDDPYITIRLKKSSTLKHMWLRNRAEPQFYQRAKGLTVWVSQDDENYTKVWSAENLGAEWMIDFPPDTQARYIRIGIEGNGIFHLLQGAVYGE
ncbi:PVC-type heme-binding CxxCH protein [Stieleria varia]|uniref:F5/8 type C domain protein n=1 Tax=Stieleria varia TaxID=2528005 RepID=A0A5C5ZYA5_9BACT|nr:PVC-type heme-binding CxxCH protein [Stieleria varia]TWT91293.1 F5/8 type C domain protein [Stieleria varia]